EVRAAKIKILKGKSALASATDWLGKQKRLRRMGLEPEHLTVGEKQILARSVGRGVRLVNAPPLIERMRMIKDAAEIGLIRAACHLGVRLFSRLQQVVRPAVSESRVAGELEFAARQAGAEQMAFSTIIAAGERSALPHGRASAAFIPAQGFVVCDFGVILAGYCSDMTRTVHVGRPQTESSSAYEAVKQAQQAAVEAVKPGAIAGEVDHAARKLLYNHGLGKFFT